MQPTPVLAAYEAPPDTSQSALHSTAQYSTPIDPLPSANVPNGTSNQEQYLVVLSGLIGSGKSTFARALCQHYPDWRRCNQDELGDRHAVLYAARTALLAGHSVVIDRTNIDAKQRRTWLELARELSIPPAPTETDATPIPPRNIITVSLTLTISTVVAQERLQVRIGHETIKTPEQALGILPHFLRSYQKSTVEEGFNYVLTYPAAKMSMDPSADEIKAILWDQLEGQTRASGVMPDRPPPRAGGGGRGRGAARGRGGRGASAVYAPHHQHQHQPYPHRQPPPSFQDPGLGPAASLNALDQQMPPPSFAAAAAAPLPTAALQSEGVTQPPTQL
ncbi:tRNA_lig_kinase domain-containing protein [Pseudozyma hubeiensis]|nr:tRNA_lig_kinase domain-containing protein [Pseudozyma hubeiensis]